MTTHQILEKRIETIEARNKRVELDKSWEGSWTRKLLIVFFTYATIGLYLKFIVGIDPWINAIVPTIGFLLSTLTLPYFKELWIKNNGKNNYDQMQKINNIFIKIHNISSDTDNSSYKNLIEKLAQDLSYTILKTAYHEFKPHGFTGILLLSESHISIHTWPEDNFAVLEMVTCKEFGKAEEKILANTIKTILHTSEFTVIVNT